MNRFDRQLSDLQNSRPPASPIAKNDLIAVAELRLLSDYVRQTTGFRLERLADILETYRDDCGRNDNVTGMQRAARSIMTLLAAPQST